MRLKILNIADVAESQLCCGCGACAYIDPDNIEMVDDLKQGRRPHIKSGCSDAPKDAQRAREAMDICPGIKQDYRGNQSHSDALKELLPAWGPVLELWEGFASDEQLRFAGSSGGVTSAIALHCIEQANMHGVLHITARPDAPILNHTVLSQSRNELLAAAGSRYAPASPCDGLDKVESAPQPCVFIGKPCDVAAVAKARTIRPTLDKNLGLTISIFCAGTPTTEGTMELLRRMKIDDPTRVQRLRYRGNGWPGRMAAETDDEREEQSNDLSYDEGWGDILQKHKQWRCHVCADHTGELADLSIGDPWYQSNEKDDHGRSLIVVRTERGRRIVRDAMNAGSVQLNQVEPWTLPASQPNLLRNRGAVWGRVWMSRLMGSAYPRFRGIPLFRFWWSQLTVKQKLQSFFGTCRRLLKRGLRSRVTILPIDEGLLKPTSSCPNTKDQLSKDDDRVHGSQRRAAA